MKSLTEWRGSCSINSCEQKGRLAQLVRAPALQAGGRRFEPCTAHHTAWQICGDVVQLVRTLPCHGRGREFESRRPRHSFQGVAGRDTGNSNPRLNPTSVSPPNSRAVPAVPDRLQEQALSLKLFIVDRVNVASRSLRFCMAQHFLDD